MENDCIWPILDPKTSEENEAEKIHHMMKIADLLQIWSNHEKFHSLFLNVSKWISIVLNSAKVESTFKDKIINVTCDFILKVEGECQDPLLMSALANSIEFWLNQGKIKMEKSSARRLKAMSIVTKVLRF